MTAILEDLPAMTGAPLFPERFNLAEYYLDRRIAEGRGDRVAIAVGDQEYTYADVQAQANRASDTLRKHGVAKEQRVLLLLFDGIAFAEAWFGTLKAGAVFCMANPLGTEEDIRYLLEYTGCTAVVADASIAQRVHAAAPDRCVARFAVGAAETERAVGTAETERAELPDGWISWEQALADADDSTHNVDTGRDDIAGWLFTSGTTGKPKGAVHFHRHFASCTELYAKRTLGLTEDDVFLSVSRLFFGYGTGTNLMFPFAVGGKAVLFSGKPTPDRIFDHIEEHAVTVLTNVPAMIRQMSESERDVDLSKVRICLSAGEALPAALYDRWKARFPTAEVLDGIGSAEMFHIYITNRLGDVKLGSLGRLVEGYEARIVDAEGKDVPVGEMGRLWICGDSTALCYWGDQDKSRETFRGDWCVTSDLFRRDEEGYFYYAGRADDMMKVRGQFVSPLEIENCLLTHPAVVECAVVAVKDDADLSIPRAYVVVREGQSRNGESSNGESSKALDDVLKCHCQAHLTRYKFPREFTYVDALPRNDRGKILRRRLLELDT